MSRVPEGRPDLFDIFMASWVLSFGNVESLNDLLPLDTLLVEGGVEFADNETVVCPTVGTTYGHDQLHVQPVSCLR